MKPEIPTGILFTDWHGPDSRTLGINHALLPLIGKPMLQRALEQLVQLGCRRIVVILGEDSARVRSLLGTGARWGCEIKFQYSRPDETLPQLLQVIAPQAAAPCWIADAQTLPDHSALEMCKTMRPGDHGSTLCWADMKQLHWSGWGLFHPSWLREQAIGTDRCAMEQLVLGTSWIERRCVPQTMAASDATTFLSSHFQLLGEGELRRITIGRDCHIDPSARLIAPVHVQSHVRVGPRCVIGPYVVLGENCVIDADVQLESSVLLPDTYVGEGLELNYVVVHGQRLANITLGAVIEITDRNVLCDLGRPLHAARRDKWIARGLQLLLRPLQWLCLLQAGDTPRSGTAPYLPSATDGPRLWARHFGQVFFPSLAQVVAGRLRMVGPVPRSEEDRRNLPPEWRQIYATARPGLLSEALLRNPAELGPDDVFASDALASADRPNGPATGRLLVRYLARVVVDLLPQALQKLMPATAHTVAGTKSPITLWRPWHEDQEPR